MKVCGQNFCPLTRGNNTEIENISIVHLCVLFLNFFKIIPVGLYF